MTKTPDIERLAREAGLYFHPSGVAGPLSPGYSGPEPKLARFAALIRDEVLEEAMAACEDYAAEVRKAGHTQADSAARRIAADIRALKATPR